MRDQEMPRLDEHLVREETREEMVRGERIISAPAREPHADRHCRLDYLISAAAAPGYVTSSDLLTRAGAASEFATDTCVRREGIDPATGTRYLEELAFEVVHTQSLREITVRAEELTNRGVRRLIAVFVKKREVAEWSESTRSWMLLPLDSTLADPVLVRPISIRAVFDAGVADNEVVDSLAAKGNPRLAQREAAILRRAIEAVCKVLGIVLGPEEQALLQSLDPAGLEALLAALETDRRWPQP
jgi:hypothetical protein